MRFGHEKGFYGGFGSTFFLPMKPSTFSKPERPQSSSSGSQNLRQRKGVLPRSQFEVGHG